MELILTVQSPKSAGTFDMMLISSGENRESKFLLIDCAVVALLEVFFFS